MLKRNEFYHLRSRLKIDFPLHLNSNVHILNKQRCCWAKTFFSLRRPLRVRRWLMDVKFCAADEEDGKGSGLKGRLDCFCSSSQCRPCPSPTIQLKWWSNCIIMFMLFSPLQHGAIITLLIKKASVNLKSFYFILIFTLESFAPSTSYVGTKQFGNWNSLKSPYFVDSLQTSREFLRSARNLLAFKY